MMEEQAEWILNTQIKRKKQGQAFNRSEAIWEGVKIRRERKDRDEMWKTRLLSDCMEDTQGGEGGGKV